MVRGDQQALGDAPFVIGFAAASAPPLSTIAIAERGGGQPIDRRANLADLPQLVFVGHDDEVPGLGVARTSGPARHFQEFREHVIRDRLRVVLPGRVAPGASPLSPHGRWRVLPSGRPPFERRFDVETEKREERRETDANDGKPQRAPRTQSDWVGRVYENTGGVGNHFVSRQSSGNGGNPLTTND